MTTPEQLESATRRPLEPINVYAVIALVAALLGLFPVAIVFGLLAFSRPAGRGVAIAALVLGVIELVTVVVLFYGLTNAFSDDSSENAAPSISTSTSGFETTLAVTTTTSAIPPPTSTALTTDAPTAETAPPVTIGDYCTTPDAQALTADQSTAYCSRRAGTDAYVWSLTAGVVPNPALPTTQTGESAPAIGSPCTTAELGQIRPSATGQRVKCGYTGEDSTLWLALD